MNNFKTAQVMTTKFSRATGLGNPSDWHKPVLLALYKRGSKKGESFLISVLLTQL